MRVRVGRRFGNYLTGFILVVSLSLLGTAAAELDAPVDNPLNISAANWYWGPANRWSWHNTRRIFPTAQISRGSGPVNPLALSTRDLSKINFIDPVTHKSMTVAEMLDATYTDGFLVLQHGQILAESYRNGMTQEQPHLLMSVSKSIMGTLAGILIGRGELDPAKLVTDYVPEMKVLCTKGQRSAIFST